MERGEYFNFLKDVNVGDIVMINLKNGGKPEDYLGRIYLLTDWKIGLKTLEVILEV